MTSRVSSGRRSIDSISSSPLLSKSGSKRSTTPIMFSNSSGVLKAAAIEKQLECTLEELCFGCIKKIKVTRDLLLINGFVLFFFYKTPQCSFLSFFDNSCLVQNLESRIGLLNHVRLRVNI